jgi:DNA-binding transcriptional MerR regulator
MSYYEDIYSLATRMNEDEDTYAPMDLFDWLDIIGNMKNEGYKLKKIGEMIGWSEDLLKRYSQLINKVSDETLKQLKNIQRESVTSKVTPVTFSEWMLRDSGIYLLNKDYQQKFIDKYTEGQYRWDNAQAIKRLTAKLYTQQQGMEYLGEKLLEGADAEQLIDNINKGLYKDLLI